MFKPINIKDIPEPKRNISIKNIDIENFIASGELAAEIEIPANKTAKQVLSMYSYAAKKNAYPVTAIMRSKRVFIVREAENAE